MPGGYKTATSTGNERDQHICCTAEAVSQRPPTRHHGGLEVGAVIRAERPTLSLNAYFVASWDIHDLRTTTNRSVGTCVRRGSAIVRETGRLELGALPTGHPVHASCPAVCCHHRAPGWTGRRPDNSATRRRTCSGHCKLCRSSRD